MINRHRTSGWRSVCHKYCQACRIEEAKEVHHIIARIDGGTDTPKNLIDLCWLCHQFAPNGVEEMKDFVKNWGFRGNLIGRGVRDALMTLATEGYFGSSTIFYDKIGIKTNKDIRKFIGDIIGHYAISFQEHFRIKDLEVNPYEYDITQGTKTK